nr:DGQHR domain-containing protein DpdB [uncultured Lamprocystis sp.]
MDPDHPLRQGAAFPVFAFCAPAKDVLQFAAIQRIGRRTDGTLHGFQRPQVAAHIKEIRAYLAGDDAVLPNSIVVAFTGNVRVQSDSGCGTVHIDCADGPPGVVVDGQQRLCALEGLQDRHFEVFVSAILCNGEDELRKQFILINNTRPLPKSLIYELLPTVEGLPGRLSSRASAARFTERLNFDEQSSLYGQIRQHTNPAGIIQDTVMQKLIMASLRDGALRRVAEQQSGEDAAFELISEFFRAVQLAFNEAWRSHTPRTSRLVHGVGIISMGYVMEYLHGAYGISKAIDFVDALSPLRDETAWTTGVWSFGEGNCRPWNSLQFVPRDYMELSHFLLGILKRRLVGGRLRALA